MRKLLIILVAVIFPIVLMISVPRLIKISEIDCTSQFGPCESFLESALAKAKSRNLIDSKSYIGKVLTKDEKVLRFSIRFKFPNRLEVNLIERKPIFAVTHEGSNRFILFDSIGVITGEALSTQLPTLVVNSDVENTKPIFAGNIMADLFNIYSVKSGKIIDDRLEVSGIEGKTAVFPLEGDRDILLGLLKLILSRLYSMSENSRIKIIDLRFKNPVLK